MSTVPALPEEFTEYVRKAEVLELPTLEEARATV